MQFIIRIIGAGIIVGFLGVFVVAEIAIRTPHGSADALQEVTIAEGLGLREVAVLLRSEGIIRHETLFMYYVWRGGRAGNLQAGNYTLGNMSIVSVASRITGGDANERGVRITIPEGFKREAIANRLVKEGVLQSAEGFLVASEGLEGQLYPDTYFFEKGTAPERIVEIMHANFNKRALPILENENTVGLSRGDALILASLIEKEVQSTSDMEGISGVLHNRLNIGMLLQVDATLLFITGKTGAELTSQDKLIDSPYNTYQHGGLPPGPIANPGARAIRAALNPAEHDFLYYLSTRDGETIFSETLEEHNINRVKYLTR